MRPDDKAIIGAAIVHDWLYAVGAEQDGAAKQTADELFRYELGQAGVNMVKRNVMFAAVSLFGGEAFGTAEEMRFRNPENGNAYIGAKPAAAVIDTVAPQCTDFLEKYWDPVVASGGPQGHYLNPEFIEEWIDLD